MRVAINSYTDSFLNQFNNLASQQYNLQSQVSTGLRVQNASDDPNAMAKTLNLLAHRSQNAQYAKNVGALQDRAGLVTNVLQSLQTTVSRAGEITTSAGSGTASKADLAAYATEINSMIDDVIKQVNAKDTASNNYLFGGTSLQNAPFSVTRDSNNQVVSVTYNGNNQTDQGQIGENQYTSVDIPGANSTSSSPRGLITDQSSGADLINHLISLRFNLQSGNTAAITGTDAANIQKDENNITYQVANNGVMLNRLSTVSTYLSNQANSLDKGVSNESSADLITTMVQLNRAQNGYQAALQSSAKIMQMSILNYIS
ncbi:MAG TPA: hypothetical protein VF607_11865 [Verrucomicrobiae bacterium]